MEHGGPGQDRLAVEALGRDQRVERLPELHQVGRAVVLALDAVERDRRDGGAQGRQGAPVGAGRRGRPGGHGGREVGPLLQAPREGRQPVHAQPEPEGPVDGPPRRPRRVHRLQRRAPALVEAQPRREIVEHRQLGVDARLGGVRAEQPLGERVDRGELGPVQAVEGRLEAPVHDQVLRAGLGLLQPPAHAVAQLGGGAFGERDRGDPLDRHPGGDERHDPVHQRARLARARARLDEHGVAQALADRDAGVVVVAHGSPTRSHGAAPASALLRAKSLPRPRAQIRVKSQTLQLSNSK